MVSKVCILTIIIAIVALESTALPPTRIKRQQDFQWNNFDTDFERVTSRRPQTPTTAAAGTTTTTPSPTYTRCIRQCPTTPEYNPICGTNRQTYPNESNLRCAVRCGLSVEKAFGGTCSPL